MYLYLRLLILSYLDACTKTLVTFNNKFFELKDAVTMGSLLVPVFVNIIMRKLKKKSIKKFVGDGTTIFYGHVVDDTLLFIKPKDVMHGHQDLNSIDKNLRCTILYTLFYALMHCFILYCTPFLDLELKPRNSGYYANDSSNIAWVFRVSWIITLATHFKNICLPVFLKD